MYADITKPPAPLPQVQSQSVSEGITLLAPLTRRGHGPGLIILQQDSAKNLDIIDGVPSTFLKWAEEGYVVAEIQAKALKKSAAEVIGDAVQALRNSSKLEPDSKIGIVAYDPDLWNKVAALIGTWPTIVGAVVYANAADENIIGKAQISVLQHLAGSRAPAANGRSNITTYYYAKAKSFRWATPFDEDFDYWAESLSHTRSLTFLKPLIGGPYFDLEYIWDEHTNYEFTDRSVEHTMSTMVEQPYVNHVPTLTGGIGRKQLTEFYRSNFIFQNSADTELELISRTIGIDRVIDEFIYKFTHNAVIDWLLPGVPPTFKKIEVPFAAVVNIRGDRLYHEHITWDQGTVLAQLGLMPQYLPFPYPIEGQEEGASYEYQVPVAGVQTALKLKDRNSVASNGMFNYQVRQK